MNTLSIGKRSKWGAAVLGAVTVAVAAGMALLAGCANNNTPAGGAQYTLTLKSEPAGSGVFSENGETIESGATFSSGTKVTVTVSPKNGKYVFLGWTGDATGTAEKVTVTMDGNKTLTAKFLEKFAVTAVADPVEGGTINRTPDSAYYALNSGVALRAIANPGYKFLGWDGDTTLPADNVLFTHRITDDVKFVAKFQQMPQVLIETTDGGSVNIDPDKDYYEKDEKVTLTATAEKGYLFTGWLDSTGKFLTDSNPYIITIDDTDVALTAEFMSF
jgi:trimeric autotransporter adhesin